VENRASIWYRIAMPPIAPPSIGIVDAVLIATGALIVIIFMLTVLWAMRPKTKRLSAKQYNAELFKRRMALDEVGYDVVNDVRVKDAQGKLVSVDNVVRMPASILLIVSAPPDAAGPVRANPNAGEWRYVCPDNRVTTMVNPVVQLHPLISAIRARFPLVRVRVLAVFPDSADFGGKDPKSCCRTSDLMTTLKSIAKEEGSPSQTVDAAWPALSGALKSQSGPAAKSGSPPGTGRHRAVS
jgi:hypothetical protein